jgi:sulfite reductase beta subunit-like hemoprotein
LCQVTTAQLLPTLEALVKTLRDLGDRQNRKHARLKYLVEEMGAAGFRREVEDRLGSSLIESSGVVFNHAETHLGWHRQKQPGLHYVGLFVENGRIVDGKSVLFKTGLREIVKRFRPQLLLTPRQDLILSDLPTEVVPSLQSALEQYGIAPQKDYSPLRVLSMACPALPTCGLAIAEAERRLPGLISELEQRGFGNESVVVRMAGCPNSCSRPPVAEIGLIGKSANGYHLYVGGSAVGTRLASLYQEDVPAEQLAPLLSELFNLYRERRQPSEDFGDWAFKAGIARLCEWSGRPFPQPASARTSGGIS